MGAERWRYLDCGAVTPFENAAVMPVLGREVAAGAEEEERRHPEEGARALVLHEREARRLVPRRHQPCRRGEEKEEEESALHWPGLYLARADLRPRRLP